MMPKDLVTARQTGWTVRDVFRMRRNPEGAFEKRFVFPPGWFSRASLPFTSALGLEARRWFACQRSSRRVMVISYPQYVQAWATAGQVTTVYYWSDNFHAYWPSRAIDAAERRAVLEADVTLTASHTKAVELRARYNEAAHKIHFVMHGGSNSPSSSERLAPADDIASLPRPLVGHWGNISGMMDLQLIEHLARALPKASLVLIGSVASQTSGDDRRVIDTCSRLPNVHFLGPRPYAEIGRYVQHMDVNLVLYRPDHPSVRVSNPSKLRDYLSCGKPVVSTPIPDVMHFWPSLIRIGASREEFVAHVDALLAAGGDGLDEERRAWAAQHTWERAASDVLAHLTGENASSGEA